MRSEPRVPKGGLISWIHNDVWIALNLDPLSSVNFSSAYLLIFAFTHRYIPLESLRTYQLSISSLTASSNSV
jgi:hypothetical protein